MNPTQIDFYKGIFLQIVLAKEKDFNMSNLIGQSAGLDPSINSLLLPEYYSKLLEQAEAFATAMGAQ